MATAAGDFLGVYFWKDHSEGLYGRIEIMSRTAHQVTAIAQAIQSRTALVHEED